MIPVFDAFDYFRSLLPLLVVILPALALIRHGWARRLVFTLSGTYLLFLIAPRLALFHLVLWGAVCALQPLVHATGERRSGKWVLGAGLVVAIAPVVAWKVWPITFVVEFNVVTNQVIRQLSSWLAGVDLTADIIGPIGLSFAAFRAADLLIKSNLGLVDRLSPGRVLSYGLFAPLLVVGPIATYGEVGTTIEGKVTLDRPRALDGVLHLASGLVKIWVLALPLAWSTDIFRVAEYNSAPRMWIALIAFGWFFYLNFAGYSDLAVGIGRLMGGDVKENFDRPYFRTDPNAFWNSWHISLTRFLRTNVFTPIAAGRPNRQTFATMVTMLFIGLWHGIGLATLLFGLYHGISLVAHRRLQASRGDTMRTGPGIHVAKSVAVFLWFTISLPMIELPFDELGPFYRTLLPW